MRSNIKTFFILLLIFVLSELVNYSVCHAQQLNCEINVKTHYPEVSKLGVKEPKPVILAYDHVVAPTAEACERQALRYCKHDPEFENYISKEVRFKFNKMDSNKLIICLFNRKPEVRLLNSSPAFQASPPSSDALPKSNKYRPSTSVGI